MKTAPEILTTPRMRGERLGPAHQDALAPILADPRVAATMGGVASAAEVAEQRTEFDGQPEVEVGWTVTPERWGEGLASELGAAAVEVAFADLGLRDVVAFTLPDNVASLRVMEKLGFVYEKTAPYRIYGDHVLYRRRS